MWDAAISARDALLQAQGSPGAPGARGPPDLWGVGEDAAAALGLQQQLLHADAASQLAAPLKEEGRGVAVWISPAPGHVIKARLQNGQKLFLNICSHPKIEPWHYKEVLAGEGQAPQGGIRIPMSIGPFAGPSPCASADTLETCWKEPQARDVLRQFACAAVARKHQLELQEKVSFPKATYKGTLPPPRQRIRVTREAHIELLTGEPAAEEPSSAAAAGQKAAAAAPYAAAGSSSLAEYLVWEGAFATPADAGAYCLYLAQGLRQQRRGPQAPPAPSSQQETAASAASPWIASWIKSCSSNNGCSSSNNCSSERIIPVGAVETDALSCGTSPSATAKTNKPRGLKKAFLVAPAAAAASSSAPRRQQAANAPSSNPGALAWEFRCTYSLKISDLELVVLPLRGALCGVEKNTTGPLNGCSLAFPLRLRSKAAFALVCTYSSCEEAKALLQQLQQQQWLPRGGALVAPREGGNATLRDTKSAASAFLLTVCLFVDTAAELALSRICPAAAAAAEAAAIEAMETAPAGAAEKEKGTKLHVEIDDSSSSDECCSEALDEPTPRL
ncbi:hypothetical protein, conserved [Eimeria brunetti]|uniref:PIH1 N-terminal domain-containing protein n=1 Tax=Eimeria brunetti TaxID=51314 RepID=U6LT08_9EIME|nr:hypothetical protein, conserved [Eimeria brunetti]